MDFYMARAILYDVLGIGMALGSFTLLFFDKRFFLVWFGCLLSLSASLLNFNVWDAPAWGLWGTYISCDDVYISCDDMAFGGWLYLIALILCMVAIIGHILSAVARRSAGWRR